MSLLNLPNPAETPEVRAYYEDVYRFGINNTFDELQFSKGQVSYGRLCKRLASIELPDPSLLPYQTLSSQWIWLITLLISLKSSRTSFGVSWKKLEGLMLWTFFQSFACLIHKVCEEE